MALIEPRSFDVVTPDVGTTRVAPLPPPLPASIELFPPPKPALASREFQSVLVDPGIDPDPWTRPWVTLWKLSRTSPSAAEIRVTPGLVETRFASR